VTALYEVVPVGVSEPGVKPTPPADRSRYAAELPKPKLDSATAKELLTVKIRYKEPDASESRKLEFPLTDSGAAFANASGDFQFAAAVASYGMILRESPYRGEANLGNVVAWAATSLARQGGADPGRYRADFIDLVRKTQGVMER
jgi:Ca-activated chloride channel family protein